MQTFITVVMIAFGVGSSTQVLVPKTEFRRTSEPNCPVAHLHSKNSQGVLPLIALADPDDRIPDPDMVNCGYGKLRDLRIFRVPSPPLPNDSDFDGIPDADDPAPFDADADDDGIPDGMSDSDGDGLTDEFEIQVSMTDPDEPDSDGDGSPDIVDYGVANFEQVYTHIPAGFGALTGSLVTALTMASLVPRLNTVGALSNARLVPSVYMENVPEDYTGGMSDGVITAPDERFALEQHFNSWLANTTMGGMYVGYAAPNYSPSTSNSRAYSRIFQPSIFVRADLSDDLRVGMAMRYAFLGLGLKSPTAGFPDDVDTNILVDPARLEAEVNANGLSQLILSPLEQARLGLENPYRAIGRQTRVDGFDVSQIAYGRGIVYDDYADTTGAAYTDLDYASIYSDDDDEVIFAISFYARPTATDLVLNTRIAFDTDDDSLADIEYVLERTRMVGEKTVSRVYANDFRTLTSEPDRDALRLGIRYKWDTGKLGAGDLYLLHFSKADIAPTVMNVPIEVFVHDENDMLVDQASLDWMRNQSDFDPTFLAIGHAGGYSSSATAPATNGVLGGVEYFAGDDVAISFAGLTPSTAFDLSVDDIIVLQDTTDASGDYSGSFPVPQGAPPGNRFLTARDATGEFAGSILVVPEPAGRDSALVALVTLALASPWIRARRANRATRVQ